MAGADSWKPWTFNGVNLAKAIVFSRRCKDEAGRQLRRSPEHAEAWLRERLAGRGYVSRIIAESAGFPASMLGLRSPSGCFAMVDGIFALALKEAREDPNKPVATRCYFSREWLQQSGFADYSVDPLDLQGRRLADSVEFSAHCVERFQERCRGSRDPRIARNQLQELVASRATVVRKRPLGVWAQSFRRADFYLVTDDGYCFPVQERGGGSRSLVALTCLHRTMSPSEGDFVTVRCACGHLNRVDKSLLTHTPTCDNCGSRMRVRVGS
jgi:hypothetical protein